MRTHLCLLFLWKRAQMRQHDSWTRDRLIDYQAQRLRKLRAYATAHSPFYRTFHKGLDDAPLSELPILTKAQLIENYDDIVTDRRLTRRALDDHLARRSPGTRFRHRYWLCATSGTSGRPAVIPFRFSEWAALLASYTRVNDWAGVHWTSLRRLRIGVVGAPTRWHQSAAASHSLRSLFLSIKRMSPADPLQDIVHRLNAHAPDVLVSFAGMAPILADEAKAGRLRIAPQAMISGAEILTADVRGRIRQAWGIEPYDMYAATEAAGMAAECPEHNGLHFFEDLLIPEVVDEADRPVPPGTPGSALLVTVLSSRTVPLIRYRLDDAITLEAGPCPCGRPFTRIKRIEGRRADTLVFARRDGTKAVLHPVCFGAIFDTLDLRGWQVIKKPNCLAVRLVAPVPEGVVHEIRRRIEQLLQELDVGGFVVRLEVVAEIPRHSSGKAILIKEERAPVEAVPV